MREFFIGNAKHFCRGSIRWLGAFFCSLVLFSACEKKDQLGNEVLPDKGNLGVSKIDTTTLEVITRSEDSIRTDESSNGLLGSYHDPLFGKVKASFYAQFLLPASNIDLGDPANLHLDSLVLSLRYAGFYGGLDKQRFQVFELSEGLNKDSEYFSNDSLGRKNGDLVKDGFEELKPRPSQKVVPHKYDTMDPQLRLRLDDAFGESFLDASGTGAFKNNSGFLDFFRGLYVTVDNSPQSKGRGGVASLDLRSFESRLNLYYRNSATGDTTQIRFVLDEGSAFFNRVETDHNNSTVGEALGDSVAGELKAYLQAGGGTKVQVRFPHLKNYVDSGMIGVNKAELVIPVAEESKGFTLPPGSIGGDLLPPVDGERNYFPSARVFALKENAEGEIMFIPDQFQGDDHVGGFYDGEREAYRINMTRHVQQVLNGTVPNNPLFLRPGNASISVNRTVLNGPQKGKRPMKLELTFSEF